MVGGMYLMTLMVMTQEMKPASVCLKSCICGGMKVASSASVLMARHLLFLSVSLVSQKKKIK